MYKQVMEPHHTHSLGGNDSKFLKRFVASKCDGDVSRVFRGASKNHRRAVRLLYEAVSAYLLTNASEEAGKLLTACRKRILWFAHYDARNKERAENAKELRKINRALAAVIKAEEAAKSFATTGITEKRHRFWDLWVKRSKAARDAIKVVEAEGLDDELAAELKARLSAAMK